MYNALFIGWQQPARGKEVQAVRVFGEFVEMLGTWKSKGQITGFTPMFLEAHGGDLGGFFSVTGEGSKLDQLTASDEFRKAITRAQIVVDGMGVVRGMTGDAIAKQMALYTSQLGELSK